MNDEDNGNFTMQMFFSIPIYSSRFNMHGTPIGLLKLAMVQSRIGSTMP